MKRAHLFSGLVVLMLGIALFVPPVCAQPEPYTEGTVWKMTFVRTKARMGDDYLRSLAGTYRKAMEEAKRQELIVSYRILMSQPANPSDWEFVLIEEFKNMAAFDGVEEKYNAIYQKQMGEEQRKSVASKRLDIREVMGVKLAREIVLK